ncbi:hypothetical protein D8810_10040 [Streptococcus gordonii]|uniref:hypothetical protein n=1 Tax=Streptococcus gordonii TaxID=1302 RepID=UPI000F668E30|nr:hypothetical protein [Streptococcus gordonii]RSJ60190.1 hypothetical protein D8810_10040 [Streptococcus gordonii]
MENVEKFYSIIEEKQSDYKNVFDFLRTFISSEKEVSYIGSRLRIDKKWGRLPPVNTMIRLAPIFDKAFFETCLREKLDSAKRDRDAEAGQKYLLKIDSTQNTTEEERLRKLKRKLKREMHLEKSWGI